MAVKFPRNRATRMPAEDLCEFAAVSISCESSACGPARSMLGQRVLASDAPPLPLGKCAKNRCNCHYIAYRDRRNFLTNRRINVELQEHRAPGMRRRSRRTGPDRRKLRLNQPLDG